MTPRPAPRPALSPKPRHARRASAAASLASAPPERVVVQSQHLETASFAEALGQSEKVRGPPRVRKTHRIPLSDVTAMLAMLRRVREQV